MGIDCKPALDSERLIIALISAELKSRKFFNTLQDLGLDDSWCQPHLDDIILACLGIDDDTNETFDFYYDVMNKHASKIDKTKSSVIKQAKAACSKLQAIRRQR